MIKSLLSDVSLPLNNEQLENLQKLTKNLSYTQAAWIAGYFWGLIDNNLSKSNLKSIVQSTEISDLNNDACSITIIYASQTGNAQRLAEQLHCDLLSVQLKSVIYNAREYNFRKIAKETFLLLVTSTHGEGDPPEDAIILYKYLFSKKAPLMKSTYFAVFSLGDSSYEYFAKAGKDFDQRFEALGAKRLYDRIDADLDYQKQAVDWRCKIVSLLQQKFETDYKLLQPISDNNIVKTDNISYSRENPLVASLISKQKITSRNSIKDIHHLEIDIAGANMCYQPGDALGVWYENDPLLVHEFVSVLDLKGEEIIDFKSQSLSLSLILQRHFELTQNTLFFVKNYIKVSNDLTLLSFISDNEKLKKIVSSMPIVDFVRRFPVKLNTKQLLMFLRPLTPRFYSISSSQLEVGEEVHITVSVVRYKINGFLRTGGASSYLVDRLDINDELKVFIEYNNNFRLPQDSSASIIMIGSGTGVAPFRAFMQHRSVSGASGKNWLFFGNPRFIDDFLYQLEWQRYFKSGILTHIDTAWSRDQVDKVYVQDKLQEKSDEVWNWINDGAYVYICGNARQMAYEVEKVLLNIIMRYGMMDLQQAGEFLDKMRIEKRYQRDIY
ncbi:NADPH-dependent assimilatory sulfite reductase flavoprotein subunit [Blochmannia endosymbiont of Colobopsis nipponica]|uniref:NADPH-dependent assimilatory sulfite reductase flavoprotein subunit n=1 Tax=Blochmannia endosymbiont of Colobopsis nipponica TaxID=2681987 RepID=UPI0017873422|nr:NADPH-dependent assimilatory sulfite reductase flavoprotein subunit [Blochmannia endosymbiont of Colobopsis nipponica]QOI11249.1 NADPH-dependent assimilatory sulfite reductase flavoprotein subunit [Blochmannia endosymbiont of Colobopsis nipponica]